MTIRDIQSHLQATYGTELSHETISNITDQVLEEVRAWQDRPLDAFYPVMYLDAISVKIKDGGKVVNKSAHIALGVDMDGVKHVLGIWVQPKEGAAFWASVCANLANRGVKDVLIVATDGLTGFPEAIEATWPAAIIQTCVVHLIRSSMRFVAYKDRKAVATALRPIYTAPSEQAARDALEDFAASQWGKKYPPTVATWQRAWERFIPFLDLPRWSAGLSTRQTLSSRSTTSYAKSRRTGAISLPRMPRSNCCGWPSSTSKKNAPGNEQKKLAHPKASHA